MYENAGDMLPRGVTCCPGLVRNTQVWTPTVWCPPEQRHTHGPPWRATPGVPPGAVSHTRARGYGEPSGNACTWHTGHTAPHPSQLLQEHPKWPPSLARRLEKPRRRLSHRRWRESQSAATWSLRRTHLQTWWLPPAGGTPSPAPHKWPPPSCRKEGRGRRPATQTPGRPAGGA